MSAPTIRCLKLKNFSTAWASVGDSLQTVWINGIRWIKNLKARLHVLKYSLEYLDRQKCRLTLGHHHHYFTSCKSPLFFISQPHVFKCRVHLREQPTTPAEMYPTWLGVWWRCRLCRCIRWTSELHTQIMWHQRVHLQQWSLHTQLLQVRTINSFKIS